MYRRFSARRGFAVWTFLEDNTVDFSRQHAAVYDDDLTGRVPALHKAEIGLGNVGSNPTSCEKSNGKDHLGIAGCAMRLPEIDAAVV
jgi:hypothetical protein